MQNIATGFYATGALWDENVRWTLIAALVLFLQGPAVFSQENAVQRVPKRTYQARGSAVMQAHPSQAQAHNSHFAKGRQPALNGCLAVPKCIVKTSR